MNEELLISLVQKYGELYDPGDPHYHDDRRRMNIWEEIAGILNETPNACKDKWKKIRENFRKANQLRKAKSEQGAKITKPIRYANELSFLIPYIQIDSDSGAPPLTTDDEDEQSFISQESHTPESKNVTKKKKTDEPLTSTRPYYETYIETKYSPDAVEEDLDPIVNFFTNLGQTVKQFPPDLRVRVKRAVFNIVSEAEEQVIMRNQAD